MSRNMTRPDIRAIRINHNQALIDVPSFDQEAELIWLPAVIEGKQVAVLFDPGSQVSVLSEEFAIQVKVTHLVDRNRAMDTETANGQQSRTLGQITRLLVTFNNVTFYGAFDVVQNLTDPVLIGMHFYRGYRGTHSCLTKRVTFIDRHNRAVSIPEMTDAERPAYENWRVAPAQPAVAEESDDSDSDSDEDDDKPQYNLRSQATAKRRRLDVAPRRGRMQPR